MQNLGAVYKALAAGELDAALSRLTGGDPGRERVAQVLDGFCRAFGAGEEAVVTLCSAPGRTEICGNHTDHQHGRVLAASVNVDFLACAAPNGTNTIRFQSQGWPLVEVALDGRGPRPEENETTASLVRGMAELAAKRGFPVAGFDAYAVSDVLPGSGLSSSAACEVLLGVIVNHLFCGDGFTPVEIAQMGQGAENAYFGKPSGLMDQTASSVGGAVAIDFADPASPRVRSVAVDLNALGYALCILDSGASHADLTGEYAAVPREMRAVAAHFGKTVLREITQAQVLGAAREGGVFVGASLRGFDANAAGLAIQNSLETVAWLAVNEDGCFLEVALHEAAPVPAVEGGREWSNLVASRAGTVVSIQAQRGRQEVAVGDTVTPGQLLIAGLYTVESVHPYGPQPDTPQQTLGPARGSVRALTYREFTVEVSRRQTVLVPRGEPLRQRAVTLFGLRLPLGIYPQTEGEARSWRRTTAWAPLGRSLPLLWEEAFVQPLEEETVYLTEEELRLAALRALRQKQREELPPGSTVAEETLTYQLEEGRCVLRAQCRCEEEIGIVRKISFE